MQYLPRVTTDRKKTERFAGYVRYGIFFGYARDLVPARAYWVCDERDLFVRGVLRIVASESVRLLGAFLSVPLWSETEHTAGTPSAALGVSERWAVVSSIMALLRSDCDHEHRVVQRQALKCLGALLSGGSPSMCEMLLVRPYLSCYRTSRTWLQVLVK